MGQSGNDIIIKGGSAEIQFDPTLFQKDPADPTNRRHKHSGLKIKEIIIEGDGEFGDYDSGQHSDGFKGTIRVVCR